LLWSARQRYLAWCACLQVSTSDPGTSLSTPVPAPVAAAAPSPGTASGVKGLYDEICKLEARLHNARKPEKQEIQRRISSLEGVLATAQTKETVDAEISHERNRMTALNSDKMDWEAAHRQLFPERAIPTVLQDASVFVPLASTSGIQTLLERLETQKKLQKDAVKRDVPRYQQNIDALEKQLFTAMLPEEVEQVLKPLREGSAQIAACRDAVKRAVVGEACRRLGAIVPALEACRRVAALEQYSRIVAEGQRLLTALSFHTDNGHRPGEIVSTVFMLENHREVFQQEEERLMQAEEEQRRAERDYASEIEFHRLHIIQVCERHEPEMLDAIVNTLDEVGPSAAWELLRPLQPDAVREFEEVAGKRITSIGSQAPQQPASGGFFSRVGRFAGRLFGGDSG
jgi:hypothetical protein